MQLVNLSKEWINDLNDIALIVSKENNVIMTSEEFIPLANLDGDVHNLRENNSDDQHFIEEIDIYYYVFRK
ncbi:hypothetical protein [Mammaliicoccus vitulinus]|uniref:hypothetical protein n=1 Tax=Mammaliicoccus vitulinus TaxID=71237 RepID=UPI00248A8F45|nr:hypothetical protein [Mammaliicoccus vitulinus]